MCSRITCSQCGKATWTGCGNHVEQALAGVAKDQRCTCEQTSNAGSFGSIFGSIFSR
ncbi:hypothetical protein [Demequina lignilytica]|uniref:Uncharacterized protein n=1 Tax=Demequina lignilytica TaxID=3051663 RepID=A0AAW7M8M4_9MICO|nr:MULTISPECIES: hypothetical protein [unclassified Demequina]MDN4477338.1 hypothetical protein [Demequina sp. SYSU T00039-1]MDN4483171.1 hypothetical protein [Demequina sp. SYSU T0a273]MDN4487511.1 hypothetical protein [Demequina sp. SYSU T00039]MDN4491019.1 hypothetical protein [Demequina sp. SYSU T00068]